MMRADDSNSNSEQIDRPATRTTVSRRSAIAGSVGAVAAAALLADGIRGAAAAVPAEPEHLWGTFETPGVEFVLQARVTIAPPIDFGECSYGHRRIIPITGGDFHGPKISGTVLSEGEDTQLVRPDGVTEICARYALRASDGTLIYIVNSGLIVRAADPKAKPHYVRTQPKFEAPRVSRYAWLNQSLFLGTLNPQPPDRHAVIIRVFRVT